MKRLLLVTAIFGLAVVGLPARATLFDFTYSGSLVDFTVPITGTYQILAFGAQGGNGLSSTGQIGASGLGAEIGGDFDLTAGEVLQIAVGGSGMGVSTSGAQGANLGAGGGGGSFVVGPGTTLLVIAGGGGGGGGNQSSALPGQGGLIGPDGGGPGGGTNGNGGAGGSPFDNPGGGGGGFFTPGTSGMGFFGPGGGGGQAFPDLAGGLSVSDCLFPISHNCNGGFGGGGGGSGGGGGGYSGGGGGSGSSPGGVAPGSGGGSSDVGFDVGTDQILFADIRSGDGEVVLELIPEPASIVLLGAALAGLVAGYPLHARVRARDLERGLGSRSTPPKIGYSRLHCSWLLTTRQQWLSASPRDYAA